MKIYNRLTNEWATPPGRVYVVNPAPEITGGDLIIAYLARDGWHEWVAVHAETAMVVGGGKTRDAAVGQASRQLRHYGREAYLKAIKTVAAKRAAAKRQGS